MNKILDNTLKDILKDEILTVNSNVFRIMHYIADIDFTAEYNIVKIDCTEKSLTINQIKKTINADNINDYSIACFIPYKKMYNYVFTIDSDNNTVNTKEFHEKMFGAYNYHVHMSYIANLNDFYSKSVFNDIRKNCIYCYVIYQHKNLNQQPKNQTINKNERLKFGSTSGTIYQNSIDFKNYCNNYFSIKYADIDKSGYYIDKNKYTIALRKYKAEKSKNRIDSVNHDTFITAVNNRLEIAKTYIINNLSDVNRINDIILTSFNHANRLYQQFIELHNTKTFKSETHCNNYIDDINRYIQRINDEINDLNK